MVRSLTALRSILIGRVMVVLVLIVLFGKGSEYAKWSDIVLRVPILIGRSVGLRRKIPDG